MDVWYHERRKDDEGEFYRKVVFQREGMRKGRTTQGFYIFTPKGDLIRGWNNRDIPKMRRYLEAALKDYKPEKGDALTDDEDGRYGRTPPEGGLVVDVYSKIVKADRDPPRNDWEKLFRTSLGRDHLWIRKDEAEALASGRWPESLTTRIVRYHLVDNTRGEPPMWGRGEIARAEISLKKGRMEGEIHVETKDGERGYKAKLLGFVQTKNGKVTRFDLVARGDYHGAGKYTSNDMPKGTFTLAVAFRIAGKGEASKVPPQGARDLRGYLGN